MTDMRETAALEQATIAAEHAAGHTPATAWRPMFPWERHVNFTALDDDMRRTYRRIEDALRGLRGAILDQFTHAIAGADDPEQLAARIRTFAADQRPQVQSAIIDTVDQIAGALMLGREKSRREVIGEAARQGVEPVRGRVPIGPSSYGGMAEAAPALLWQRMTMAATEAATPRATAEEVVRAVRNASIKGAVDRARQSAHVAHGQGRTIGVDQLPTPAEIYASELLDTNTCDPCRAVDGTEYASLDEAMVDYPQSGPYAHCQGGARCRGTLVFVWPGEGT